MSAPQKTSFLYKLSVILDATQDSELANREHQRRSSITGCWRPSGREPGEISGFCHPAATFGCHNAASSDLPQHRLLKGSSSCLLNQGEEKLY